MDDADGRVMCCPGVPEKPEGEDLVCRWEVGWIWEHTWSTREKGECACVDAGDQEGMCGGGSLRKAFSSCFCFSQGDQVTVTLGTVTLGAGCCVGERRCENSSDREMKVPGKHSMLAGLSSEITIVYSNEGGAFWGFAPLLGGPCGVRGNVPSARFVAWSRECAEGEGIMAAQGVARRVIEIIDRRI